MAITAKKTPLGGLAGKLLSSNILSEEIISAATADAEDKNLPLVRYLIEHNLVDSRTLAKLISEQFGFSEVFSGPVGFRKVREAGRIQILQGFV